MSILDLLPKIRRRQQDACTHTSIEIAMTYDELSCADCGAVLNPWQFLRDQTQRVDTHEAQFHEFEMQLEEIRRRAAEEIARCNKEISELYEIKGKFANEMHGGSTLGSWRARSRRRKVAPK